MNTNPENIDQLFKSTLEGFTQTPPVGFESIASQLGSTTAKVAVKTGLSWGIKTALVVSGVAAISGIAYWFNSESSKPIVSAAKPTSVDGNRLNIDTNDSTATVVQKVQGEELKWICKIGQGTAFDINSIKLDSAAIVSKFDNAGSVYQIPLMNSVVDTVAKVKNDPKVVTNSDVPKLVVKCRDLYTVQTQEVENKAQLFQVQAMPGREINQLKIYFGDGTWANMVEPKQAVTVHRYYVEKPKQFNCAVVVQLSSGCKDSQILVVTANPSFEAPQILIPNVFTPNADGKNDVYHLNIPEPKQFELLILDVRNQPVFKATNVNETWDGYCGKMPCKAGDYKAILKREYSGEKPNVETYIIHLTRNNNE